MALCLGLVSMYFGAAYYFMPMFVSYFNDLYLVVLNLFPVFLVVFLLYFIFNKVWLSFLISSAVFVTLSFANYWKLIIRDDPLLAADLPLFFESLNMAGEYNTDFNWKMISVIIACIAGTVFALFFVKAKIDSLKIRLSASVAVILIGAVSFSYIYADGKIYSQRENNELINKWSFTQVYISKGFIYPFIHSIKSCFHTPPKGYSKRAASEMLSAYSYCDIAEDKKVNVISIMLEAYNDFSKFDQIEFGIDVYEDFHLLKDESYFGQLLTNVISGGTVNTEWSFLTGFTSLYNFRTDVNSYARYFKEQGYSVEGSHPGYDWFYNRKNINRYLGFDNYYFRENHYGEISGIKIANDNILFGEIIKLYEVNRKTGRPYFSFNVTYQNHGPYSSEKLALEDYVVNKGYGEEEYNILNNYFSGIYSTNKELKRLIDYFSKVEEPVVVILFGDHNPWLGDKNSVYHMLGINLDLDTEEGFCNYYCTPYIIWGNDRAKEVLDCDFKGEGPTIGPYFLMSEFFDLAGYGGNEFMKASFLLREKIDAAHVNGIYKESGRLTKELSLESEKALNEFSYIEYYYKKNLR